MQPFTVGVLLLALIGCYTEQSEQTPIIKCSLKRWFMNTNTRSTAVNTRRSDGWCIQWWCRSYCRQHCHWIVCVHGVHWRGGSTVWRARKHSREYKRIQNEIKAVVKIAIHRCIKLTVINIPTFDLNISWFRGTFARSLIKTAFWSFAKYIVMLLVFFCS